MTIPQLHMYDLKTGEYTGSRDATQRPNGEYILEATGATPVALPASIPSGHVARWTGDAWETVEDHRQHMDERGRKEGGTPYWLPGDTWRSEPRYTDELGPLPENALLERPERPLDEYKADKRREIAAGYTAALTATLTMPAESPSAAEVATGAALFAADDAVGLADVQAILTSRRNEFLTAVDAATNREYLEALTIDYPV
ncbi:phage tail protein [Bilophila wadsworthia]|uniref:phage tail protein n=1 Tax=Bilophila wadsworthia TaxID=35833 RepID=UPI001D0B7883|nr:phage tail protein [Bilophila wadsworthia]MBS5377396.1 phage tail protein [Bilophila wadsworthia]MCB8570253.1 phage tail protein [Bilophila wadsworthia]MCC2714272.1 phage tail protein [Bilophila wadsworthia]